MTEKKRSIRPRFLVLLGALGILGLLATIGSIRYSESPSFCRSCHIMEPYYQAWAGSKHNGVAVCVDCHYTPAGPRTLAWKKFQALSQVVKYVTRTYSSKPFAEVDDASCTRSGCHSNRLLEGRLITKRGIIFDHRPHLTELRRGRQLRCTSCHSQVVVGRHIEVTYETCFLCHFKGRGEGRALKPLAGCTACHEMPERTIVIGGMKFNHRDVVKQRKLNCQECHVDIVHGKGGVSQDRCFACHNQPEKIAKFGDIPFMHENHVTKHNVACFHCHDTIRHGFNADAGAAPTLAFDCSYCHQRMHTGQLEMFTGSIKALGLPVMPSPMRQANVDCVGCHYQEKTDAAQEFRGRTYKASQQACVKCHGPKFKGIWEETKTELIATLDKMDEKVAALAKQDGLAPEEQKTFDEAKHLVQLVRAARGEHNIYLASLALRKADAVFNRLAEKRKLQAADLSSLPLISGGYCATLCHAKVGVKVPPETVKHDGKAMPHKIHADMMGCVNCHDIGAHKKVPLKQGHQAKCDECHPK